MKRFWLIGLILVLVGWAGAAGAVVELLSTTSTKPSGTDSALSIDFNVPVDTQLLLVSITNMATASVSSVKLTSSNLFCRFAGESAPSGKSTRSAMFYYKNPPLGDQQITASISSSTYHRAIAVMCFRGVDLNKFDAPTSSWGVAGQTPLVKTGGGSTTSNTNMVFSSTEAPAGSLVLSALSNDDTFSILGGPAHGERWSEESMNAAFNKGYYKGSSITGTSTGAKVEWNCSGGSNWALLGTVIPPHAGPQDIVVSPGPSLTVGDDAANNSVVGTLQVVDPLNGAPYTWVLVDNAGGRFKLSQSTGNTINVLVNDTALIDASQAASHTIRVSVDDAPGDNPPLVKDFDIAVTDTTKPVCGLLTAAPNLTRDLGTVALSVPITDNVGVAANPQMTAAGMLLGSPSLIGNTYTWICLLPANMPEGPVNISVTARDAAGNESTRTFNTTPVVDNTPPTLTGFSISDTIVRSGQQVHLSINATDAHGLAGAPTLNAGGEVIGAGAMSGSVCNWYFSLPTSMPDGFVALGITATDVVGNIKTADDPQLLILDNTPPTITGLHSSAAWVGAGAVVTIDANITDANGLNGIPTLTFNGKALPAPSVDESKHTWTYTIAANETEGAATLTFQALDLAGNTRTLTPSTALITVDRQPPVLAGLTVTPTLAKVGATVAITVSATDNRGLSAPPVLTVAGFSGGTPTQNGNIFSWSFTVPAGAVEGPALVMVTAQDRAGNQQSISNSVLKIDPNPPALTGVIATPDKAKTGTSVTIRAVITDYTAVANTPSLSVNGVVAGFVGRTGATYSWTYTIPSTATEGDALIAFHAADTLGNSADYPLTGILVVDNTPPVIGNIEASPNIAKGDDIVRITFDASDAHTAVFDPPLLTVNGAAASFYGKEGNRYEFRYTVSTVDPDGATDILLTARDTLGNTASMHDPNALRIDNTVPTISGITVDPQYAKGGARVIIGFRVNDDLGLSGNPQVSINGNEAAYNGSENDHFEYAYTIDEVRDVDGPAQLLVTINDTIGNTGQSQSGNLLHIDMTPPGGAIQIANGAVFTRDTAVSLTFQPDDGPLGSGVVQVSLSDDGASWLPWENLSPTREWQLQPGKGWKWVYARYLDRAGNVTSQPMSDRIALNPFPLAVDQESPPIVKADQGGGTVLEVSVRNIFGGAVTYDWRKNGQSLAGELGQDKTNGPVLILDELNLSDAGEYTCSVSDELELAESAPFEIQIGNTSALPVSGLGAVAATAGLMLLAAWRRRR